MTLFPYKLKRIPAASDLPSKIKKETNFQNSTLIYCNLTQNNLEFLKLSTVQWSLWALPSLQKSVKNFQACLKPVIFSNLV